MPRVVLYGLVVVTIVVGVLFGGLTALVICVLLARTIMVMALMALFP